MAKVLILLDKSPFTSFGRIAHSFVEALEGEHEIEICYLTSPEYFPKNTDLHGFKVHSPKFFLGLYLYKIGLRKVVKQFKPDWLIAIRPELGFLVADIHKRFPHIKTSVMIHDMFAETLYPNSLKFKIINQFFINPMLVADSFVYNSTYSLNETRKHYGLTKGQCVIGCVIHPDQFYPLPMTQEEVRASLSTKWEVPRDKKVYLTLCLDEPRKNIATFFRIAKELPDSIFIRVGELTTWMERFLVDHEITNVRHYNKLPLIDIRELYNLSDALVYTSYLEGFGYPPLEAMACGTQVIASNTSAMRENLKGVAQLVDHPDSVDEFVSAINMATISPVSRITMMEHIQKFSLEVFSQKLREHLTSLQVS